MRIDPEFPDPEWPQAWEVRLPDGTTEWFYNYLGAVEEAAARGMRLPAEADWAAVSAARSPALPASGGGFPGVWFPSVGRIAHGGLAAVSWMDFAGHWPVDFSV